MHAWNLEDKGNISLFSWVKDEVYIPSENKRIRGDHDVLYRIKKTDKQQNTHNTSRLSSKNFVFEAVQ